MKRLKKLEKILIIVLLFLSVVLGAGLGILISAFDDVTDISQLENFKPEIPSKIYDRNGELISELFTVKRDPVTFEELPENLINAIIAVEDSAFYEHHGIHFKRVFGALMANIRSGRIEQGASTITMQLARTLFTGREKTYSRKIKEIWLALKIEKKYSKNEILTLYFNQIYFGHGAYGIQAASQFYFNKPIDDLTLAECAMLAGLPQSPNRLSPLRNPVLARQRQELVLERMVQERMVMPEEAYESYQDFWIGFRLQMRSPSQSVYKLQENKAPHFVEYVRQKLEKLYGSERIYTDGLKVYTSLDLSQQAYAEKYLKEGLDRQNEIYAQNIRLVRESIDKRFIDSLDMLSLVFNLEHINIGSHKNQERVLTYLDERVLAPLDMVSFLFGTNDIKRIIEGSYLIEESAGEFQKVEGALIAIEPQNGYITAMVGGSTFSEDNQINRAVQIRRQTGSGFKPYIYSAAIDTEIFNPASIIVDSPVIFYDGEEQWIPDNYSGTYRGKLRLREALRRSVNVVTAKIVDRLGVDTVIRYASSIIGITDPDEIAQRFPRVYSIALGVVELSPYEQAKGFCTFANQGEEVTPIAILYVLDRDGNLIDNFEAELRKEEMRKGRRQILSEKTNFIIVDMLRDVLRPGGTGYRAATTNGFDKPAAGKTGTTQNWKDAWFTGFTPDLVASVWVGFDRNSISLGRGQAGGVVAAPIWAQFMRDATQDRPVTWYSRPKGVYAITIDRNTGLLPKKGCKNIMTEYFLEGTVPTEYSAECGDAQTRESFNIDIFNRGEESSSIFKNTPESGITDYRDFEFEDQYRFGIEEEGYDPGDNQSYMGEDPIEPPIDLDLNGEDTLSDEEIPGTGTDTGNSSSLWANPDLTAEEDSFEPSEPTQAVPAPRKGPASRKGPAPLEELEEPSPSE